MLKQLLSLRRESPAREIDEILNRSDWEGYLWVNGGQGLFNLINGEYSTQEGPMKPSIPGISISACSDRVSRTDKISPEYLELLGEREIQMMREVPRVVEVNPRYRVELDEAQGNRVMELVTFLRQNGASCFLLILNGRKVSKLRVAVQFDSETVSLVVLQGNLIVDFSEAVPIAGMVL